MAVHANSLVAVLAEDERFAVLEHQGVIRLAVFLGESDQAPSLKMLQFWRISTNDVPLCSRRVGACPARCRAVDDRRCARRRCASAPSATEIGLNGWSMEPSGLRLRLLAELGRRRVLAFGQAVDPVVEQQDVDVEVAPQAVDQVVAADADSASPSPVTTQTDSSGPATFKPGGDRRRAAVDAVEAVGVHVVREAAGAADAGDEDDVLARHAELRQHLLHLGEDRSSRRSRGTSGRPGRRRSPCGRQRCAAARCRSSWPCAIHHRALQRFVRRSRRP